MMSDTLGEIPAEMKIPLYPFSKYELLKIPQYSGTAPAIRPSRRTCFFSLASFSTDTVSVFWRWFRSESERRKNRKNDERYIGRNPGGNEDSFISVLKVWTKRLAHIVIGSAANITGPDIIARNDARLFIQIPEVLAAFGLNPKGGKIGKMMSDTLGEIPAEMKIPLYLILL
jgi:hypothetical protein